MTSFLITDAQSKARVLSFIDGLSLDRQWDVEIARHVAIRSVQQNRLYHKWVGIIARDQGYSHNGMHEALKLEFLPPEFVPVRGHVHKVTQSTTKLKVGEMSEYMKAVEQWANGECIRLPTPEEMYAR